MVSLVKLDDVASLAAVGSALVATAAAWIAVWQARTAGKAARAAEAQARAADRQAKAAEEQVVLMRSQVKQQERIMDAAQSPVFEVRDQEDRMDDERRVEFSIKMTSGSPLRHVSVTARGEHVRWFEGPGALRSSTVEWPSVAVGSERRLVLQLEHEAPSSTQVMLELEPVGLEGKPVGVNQIALMAELMEPPRDYSKEFTAFSRRRRS